MPLNEYRSKRNFGMTPEPAGRIRRKGRSHIFVVQKHDASRLHYDLRLEINGVLVSWAVPKGPSMNPADKRMAIRTEDHPIEYADFEGVIPEGQYGAGTVMVWDKGTYESKDGTRPDEQLARGKVDVILQGKKLRGGFTLVRSKKLSAARPQAENWLLIKHRDEFAEDRWDIESHDLNLSVLTNRILEEIAQGRSGRKRPRSGRSTRTGL